MHEIINGFLEASTLCTEHKIITSFLKANTLCNECAFGVLLARFLIVHQLAIFFYLKRLKRHHESVHNSP